MVSDIHSAHILKLLTIRQAPTRSSGNEKRGRGRPRKNADSSSSQTKNIPSQAKKRKQEQRTSQGSTKKRSSQGQAVENNSRATAEGADKPRGRKRKVPATEDDELEGAMAQNSSTQVQKRKTKEVDIDELEQAAAETGTTRKYVHLAPKTKRIRQEVLQGWPEISPAVMEQVSFVLKRAKNEVVYTRRDPRRADEAQDVLGATIRQLERSLSTMKIPPQTKGLHFNLDRLADSNEHVYRDVTTARHSKQLLEQQVDNAQRRLEAEQEAANRLKKNAQQWKSRWKIQEKKQVCHCARCTSAELRADDG